MMDQEIEEQTQQQINNNKYTAKDLAGLNVRHDKDTFVDGSTTILTLADAGVLDDDAKDELVNVNIEEDERHTENVERKKGAKGFLEDYNALDDDEFETPGQAKAKKTLSKYDDIDVVSGDQKRKEKKKFTLGAEGTADWKREKREAEIRDKLLKQSVTLDYEVKMDGADFYTKEEVQQKFKKKKRRKVRKSKAPKAVTADDLEVLASEAPGNPGSDRGKRGDRGKRKRGAEEPDKAAAPTSSEAPASSGSSPKAANQDPVAAGMDVEDDDDEEEADAFDQSHFIDDDPLEDEAEVDAQAEIAAAMARTKRIKAKKNNAKKASRIATLIKRAGQDDAEEAGGGDADTGGAESLNFTDMSEFVRQVGQASDDKKPKAKDKTLVVPSDQMDEAEDEAVKAAKAADKEKEKESTSRKGWTEAANDQPGAQEDAEDAERSKALGAEINVSGGIMAALQFSKLRGFLDEDAAFGKRDRFKQMYQADRFGAGEASSDEEDGPAKKDDRGRDRDRDRRDRDRDRRDGDRDGFQRQDIDKKNYNPTIKLEYRDDSGRVMTDKKEAFRHLSHKFHGKGSGRGKTEKRLIKQQEEMLSRKMLAGDTPLGMTSMMRKKMEATGSAHIVMSGTQQSSVRKGKKKS